MTESVLEHHEIVTDSGRIGAGLAGVDEDQAAQSRLGTCPECSLKFADVVAHAATEHPGLNLGIPNDPDQLRALADSIEAARAADKVRAEANDNGGVDYAVDVDDSLRSADRAF